MGRRPPRNGFADRRLPGSLVAPALVAAALAVLPLGYLLLRAVEAGGRQVAEIVLRERTAELLGRSLLLTGLVTVGATVIGVGVATLVARTDLPGRRTIGVLAALPLAVPSYVAAFTWISAVPAVEGLFGAVLVLVACTYPYVYLPVLAALRHADPAGEEVARSLGRGPARTFWSVTLRQVRPAVASGALLVALYALSDFGGVSVLRYDVFTRVIYTSYRASFDRTPAAVLAILLVLLTVLIAVGEARTRDGSEQVRVGGATARTPASWPLGRWRGPALAAAIVVLVAALGVPIASLGYWSASGLSAGIQVTHLVASALATLWFSLLGGTACLLLAIPVGILAARHSGPVVGGIERATWAGHALPGIVVALSLVFFGIRVAQPIYQRTPLLVIAYVILLLPAAVAAVRVNVAMSSPQVEQVARSLGCTPAQVARRVTVPLATPGIAAGFALVVLTCMKELPATLLLHPTGADTLATSLWTRTGVGAYAAAAPYAALLVVLAVLPTLWLLAAQGRLPDAGGRGHGR